MSTPGDKYRLFHFLRDHAYGGECKDHLGTIEFDDDGDDASRLGFTPEEAHAVVDELCSAHLLERVPDEREPADAHHETLMVRPVNDLMAATLIVALD